MEQLLLHLLGDYIIQNDNVGVRKKEKSITGHLYCSWHCITYSIPFLLITSWQAAALIGIGHYLIDRYNWLTTLIALKNNTTCKDNFGYKADRPFPITIWLYIIQDNTLHLLWNYLIIWGVEKWM